jgi:peptidoglycan hydrolase-like protein with peptidoglycan-binding domain
MRSVLTVTATTALLTLSMTGLAAASPGGVGGAGVVSVPADTPIPPILQQPPADPAPPEDPPPGTAPDPATPDPATPDPATPGAEKPGSEPPGTESPEAGTPGAAEDPAQTTATPETAAVPALPAVKPGAGKALLAKGARGKKVRELQVRLQRVGQYDFPVTGEYGKKTVAAVKGFQKKLNFVRSGAVDAATQNELATRGGRVRNADIAAGENRPYGSRPAASCLVGHVVCVDSTARTVRWVEDGKVKLTLDARFGARATPTRTGVFSIYFKSRDHVSRLYGSSMPFAMFFSGGQAVHYSSDFAARGYYGASHGCINTRQYKKMARLFELAGVGDRVVVYQSRPIKG